MMSYFTQYLEKLALEANDPTDQLARHRPISGDPATPVAPSPQPTKPNEEPQKMSFAWFEQKIAECSMPKAKPMKGEKPKKMPAGDEQPEQKNASAMDEYELAIYEKVAMAKVMNDIQK